MKFRLLAASSASFLTSVFFMATAARAEWLMQILSVQISDKTVTIHAQNLPGGPLNVKFNGITLTSRYEPKAQQIVATLPAVPSPGTYLLSVAKKELPLATA